MHAFRQIPLAAAFALAACGGDSGGTAATTTQRGSSSPTASAGASSTTVASAATVVTTAANVTTPQGSQPPTAPGVLPRGADPVQLDPATFTTDIDHPYWPMKPGTRWTFLGTDADGDPLDVVLTVTNETKTLANGVTGRVVRDTAIQDGEITQDTVEWYAQDGDGNIWYLGKDTAEFDAGTKVSNAGSWAAGVDKALPGVALPANPRPGMTYRREYSAAHAENNGEVVSVTGQVDVPFGHFTDLLTTKDTNALDTSLVEQRLYASGVGPVQIVDLTGGGRLDLFKVDQAPASAGTGPLGSPNP